MEPEGSLPHSLEQVTCPYPQRDKSSPPQYYPPIYAWVFQVTSFPQVSQPTPCTHLSSPPYVLHAPPNSFFFIWAPE